MPQNLDKDGLRSKINSYELFFIDIWGVIHNGLQIFEDSIEVLENLKKNNKEFVLLTNAPRPNSTVIDFLKKIGKCIHLRRSFTKISNRKFSKFKILSHWTTKRFWLI